MDIPTITRYINSQSSLLFGIFPIMVLLVTGKPSMCKTVPTTIQHRISSHDRILTTKAGSCDGALASAHRPKQVYVLIAMSTQKSRLRSWSLVETRVCRYTGFNGFCVRKRGRAVGCMLLATTEHIIGALARTQVGPRFVCLANNPPKKVSRSLEHR